MSSLFFKSIIIITFISFLNLPSFAQKNKQKKLEKNINEIVIATVGNESITVEDLEKAFKKNMNRKDTKLSQISKDSLYDFLNLYINYRLKVQDAIRRGFEKDSSIIEDFENNRKMLAESYFYEKKLIEPLVEKMLEQRQWELQIAIIVINFSSQKDKGFDTIDAYDKAYQILKEINSGKDFSDLAKIYSDYKKSSGEGGTIREYITAGKVKRNIEELIYSLKEGEVYKEPIRTNEGYFILKLIKKEPRIKVKGSHILIAYDNNIDSSITEAKADSIYNELKEGKDFATLAEKLSDDPGSAIRGGSLGFWYSRADGFENSGRRLVPEFEDALFTLKNGQISRPIKTEFGLHIIKRDSTSKFDRNSERDDIKKLYKRLYFEEDKKTLIDSLRKSYNFEIYEQVLNNIVYYFDNTKTNLDSAWDSKLPEDLMYKGIFNILGQEFKVGYLITNLKNTRKNELRGIALNKDGFIKAINILTEPIVFNEASKNLENEYPDFKVLIKEFRDGILLFKVEEIEVWRNLKFDTALAKSYWDTTKTKYMTEKQYDISEIYVLSDSLAKDIYNKIKNGEDFSSLAETFTQRSGFKEKKGYYGNVSPKSNKLAKTIEEKKIKVGEITEPFQFEKGYSIVKLLSISEPRQKTFEEAIPDFAPQVQDIYQKQLTKNWLDNIKKVIPVKIYKDRIEKYQKSK
jgi:peptidyl-prolyl cis-trans isomerase SurA